MNSCGKLLRYDRGMSVPRERSVGAEVISSSDEDGPEMVPSKVTLTVPPDQDYTGPTKEGALLGLDRQALPGQAWEGRAAPPGLEERQLHSWGEDIYPPREVPERIDDPRRREDPVVKCLKIGRLRDLSDDYTRSWFKYSQSAFHRVQQELSKHSVDTMHLSFMFSNLGSIVRPQQAGKRKEQKNELLFAFWG